MAKDTTSDARTDENWKPKSLMKPAHWRVKVADFFSLMALGCLVTGPVIVVYLYWYAWQIGLYPHPNAPPINHRGVWSSHNELGRGVFLLTNPLFAAFAFAILSVLFKPTRRAAVILAFCGLFAVFAVSLIALVED